MCQLGGNGAWEPGFSQTVANSSTLHLLAVGERRFSGSHGCQKLHLLFFPHGAVVCENTAERRWWRRDCGRQLHIKGPYTPGANLQGILRRRKGEQLDL